MAQGYCFVEATRFQLCDWSQPGYWMEPSLTSLMSILAGAAGLDGHAHHAHHALRAPHRAPKLNASEEKKLRRSGRKVRTGSSVAVQFGRPWSGFPL